MTDDYDALPASCYCMTRGDDLWTYHATVLTVNSELCELWTHHGVIVGNESCQMNAVIVQFILKFPKVVICDHNRFKRTAVKAATEKYNLTGLYDLLGRRYSFLQPSYDV